MKRITFSKLKKLGLALIVIGSLSLTLLHFYDNFLNPAAKANTAFMTPMFLFTGYISLTGGLFFVILDFFWELVFGRSLSSYSKGKNSISY